MKDRQRIGFESLPDWPTMLRISRKIRTCICERNYVGFIQMGRRQKNKEKKQGKKIIYKNILIE